MEVLGCIPVADYQEGRIRKSITGPTQECRARLFQTHRSGGNACLET